MKEKVILAYSGGLDTTAIIPWLNTTMMLSAYVQTVVRKRSWTDLSRELSHVVLLSYI